MVFIQFKLFWIFSKLNVENKTNVNNLKIYHVVKKNVIIITLVIFFKALKRDREFGAKNAVH